ncbi:hypothetical protein DSY4069 [Desulfitobacterium hafniense Y51]|uniref:Uncharacterized protein n=1 Tax=Desulfitobacterium hafniense (strain Y51) TaxID=138119 RepID=Q24Q34_DESHY|nr:hypothetical protein DSY4069 [Desulfitobacterium hafniense Y51]
MCFAGSLNRERDSLKDIVSRILFYIVRSMSCADKTNAKSQPLRRDAGQIAPAQWPVGNVLFPTRLRCSLFAKFCFRSLKFALFCKTKSLGSFSSICSRIFSGLSSRLSSGFGSGLGSGLGSEGALCVKLRDLDKILDTE